MLRILATSAVVITLMAGVSPVLAQQVNGPKAHHNTQTIGGNGGSVGPAAGIGSSAVVGSGNNRGSNIGTSKNKNTNTSTNTNKNTNTNVNANSNRQSQGQQQGQAQGQGQYQGYEGEQNVNFGGTSFDRYAPSVSAPALTAAGTGVCLGSISGSLMGPMAGIGFGKTTVDKGCERRSEAALLFNMGHQRAALRVLAGESITEALDAEGSLPAPKQQAAASTPALRVDEAVLQSTNFGQIPQGN